MAAYCYALAATGRSEVCPSAEVTCGMIPSANQGRGENHMGHSRYDDASRERAAWNAGKKVGTKRPFTQKQIWAIRFFLDRERRARDRALFDLAIDSKLRGCDLVKIRIRDLLAGPEIRTRSTVIQQKTGRPVHHRRCESEPACMARTKRRHGGGLRVSEPNRSHETHEHEAVCTPGR